MKPTALEAKAIVAEWARTFGRAKSMQEWYACVTPNATEFHPIYPALIEAPMFEGLQGARFSEPPRSAGPRLVLNEEVYHIWDDVILRVAAGTTTRMDADGTISHHLNRETLLFVRRDGKWLLAHNHVSPPPNDFPYGHNQFAHGTLEYRS